RKFPAHAQAAPLCVRRASERRVLHWVGWRSNLSPEAFMRRAGLFHDLAIPATRQVFFLCVVFKISSGIRNRSTGLSPKICDSIISSTSSGFTLPYQTPSG